MFLKVSVERGFNSEGRFDFWKQAHTQEKVTEDFLHCLEEMDN